MACFASAECVIFRERAIRAIGERAGRAFEGVREATKAVPAASVSSSSLPLKFWSGLGIRPYLKPLEHPSAATAEHTAEASRPGAVHYRCGSSIPPDRRRVVRQRRVVVVVGVQSRLGLRRDLRVLGGRGLLRFG